MRLKNHGSILLALCLGTVSAAWADEIPSICAGPSALLSLANRPTVADSACVVPFEKGIMEGGAQYNHLKGSKSGYNLPQYELRLGLPAKTELSITAPNFTHQTRSPHAGWGPATVGLKHELGYNAKWLGTVEGLLTLPSGGSAFGSDGLGATLNGIVNYTLNAAWNVTFMLGVSTQVLSYSAGGQRYNSVNPDLVLTWQTSPRFQTFGEVYGQSKTAPNAGAGFNADAGIQYLLTPNLVSDVELGQRISGKLGLFNNYVGAGLAWLF